MVDITKKDLGNNNKVSEGIFVQYENLMRNKNCSYYAVDKKFQQVTDEQIKAFGEAHKIDVSKPVTVKKQEGPVKEEEHKTEVVKEDDKKPARRQSIGI